MADYYSNSISRRKRRSRKVYSGKMLALFLADIFVTLFMAVLLFLTITAMVCQYISPEKSGALSVVALGAPVIYLLDIVVMFYWIVRWRWYRAVVMMVVVVVGLFYMPRYYKFEIDRKYDTSYVERRFTKVMTYNVLDGNGEGLAEFIGKHNPDILCLQEMSVDGENWSALTERYKSIYKPQVATGGNQILSKFRIIRSGNIADLQICDGIWADLKVKDDTIRVVSIHLQPISFRQEEDTNFVEQYEESRDSVRDGKLRSMIVRLVDNNRKRATQAEVVAEFLKVSPYKTIVCGGFNDVPLSYTYNCIADGFDDTFSKMADGMVNTYKVRYPLLRIDNILVSPSVEVVSYEVDNEVEYSDHYPVISRVKF